jgi:hypothetical protein
MAGVILLTKNEERMKEQRRDAINYLRGQPGIAQCFGHAVLGGRTAPGQDLRRARPSGRG